MSTLTVEQSNKLSKILGNLSQKFEYFANNCSTQELLQKKRESSEKNNSNINNDNNNLNNDEKNYSETEIIELSSVENNDENIDENEKIFTEKEKFENSYDNNPIKIKHKNQLSKTKIKKKGEYILKEGLDKCKVINVKRGWDIDLTVCGLRIQFGPFPTEKKARVVVKYIYNNKEFLNNLNGSEPKKEWLNNLSSLLEDLLE